MHHSTGRVLLQTFYLEDTLSLAPTRLVQHTAEVSTHLCKITLMKVNHFIDKLN